MSTISVANITDGTDTVGTSYVVNGSAKAWVNFDGTGTIAARDSLNLSSLTDNGTGNYTVNFSNAFGAADYIKTTHASTPTSGGSFGEYLASAPTTSAIQYGYQNNSAVLTDYSQISTASYGDLA